MVYAYIWIAVIVVAVIMEAATAGLVAIWFMPPAAIALILGLCGVEFWIQLTVFLLLSLGCVLFARPFFTRRFKRVATNVDALIGEKVVVTEKIENIVGRGQVKLSKNGQRWSARSMRDDVEYSEGEILTVVAIEGVKLICKKQ